MPIMIPELFTILLPRITPRVLEMINDHLTDEQIALLFVKLINPYVVLSLQEEDILRGVDRKTLRGMKSRGEAPNPVQNAPKIPNKNRSRQNRCKTHASNRRDPVSLGKLNKEVIMILSAIHCCHSRVAALSVLFFNWQGKFQPEERGY